MLGADYKLGDVLLSNDVFWGCDEGTLGWGVLLVCFDKARKQGYGVPFVTQTVELRGQ